MQWYAAIFTCRSYQEKISSLQRGAEQKSMVMMRGMMPGPTRPIKKTTLKRIARTFVPYRAQIVWTALGVLFSATLGLLSPFFLQTIVNQGLLAHRLDIITRYTLFTLTATILGTAASVGYGYLSIMVGQRIMRDLRNQLYDHLQ